MAHFPLACVSIALLLSTGAVQASEQAAADAHQVHDRLEHRSAEVARLQHTVAEQESKSRAADRRLREQDRQLEALRHQLQALQSSPAPREGGQQRPATLKKPMQQ